LRKRKQVEALTLTKQVFAIYQFPKYAGIRGKNKYETSHFVSPIFGTKVKDIVTVPFQVKTLGDTTKRFDAFRTKVKLSDNEAVKKYGTKYYEFTNIVTDRTREEYFGTSTYETSPQIGKKEETKKPFIKPISKTFVQKETAKEVHVLPSFEPKTKVVEMKPEMYEETLEDEPEIKVNKEPIFETFKRPDSFEHTTKEVFSSDFETKQKTDEHHLLEPRSLEPDRKNYIYPDISLFSKKDRDLNEQPQWLLDQIDVINATLQEFGIEGQVNSSKKGPTVTRYEIALEPGVNVKRISNISDNLMMNLASKSMRIEAPIPGKPYVGLEVPNVTPEIVAFGNVISNPKFLNDVEHPLKVALGVDIDGEDIFVDIQSMPHGLIAGATNSGKSVCVNTILVSLLLKNSPDDLKLILIDPKMVELIAYNDLPHLVTPVITDAKMAAQALNWAVTEMDKRYQRFASSRSRDIKSYNLNVKRGLVDSKKMPYIVIVIDELADLIMVAPHEVENAIQRITQKARAAGIHLLVATQRPTTDVVKGTIKSNIPARIAFKVASFVDSTTILDGAGAETLLGKGDMLLKKDDRAHRLQGAYIPDDEIYAITDFIRAHTKPDYIFQHEELRQQVEMNEIASDDLFDDVAYFVVENQNASINSIQKQFEIGFNRAQKIVEMLEYYQIVSQGQGTKAREVLLTLSELDDLLGNKQ